MKFLLDQDVYTLTVRFLREQGHDVVTASELGMSRAEDEQLLTTASEQRRIIYSFSKINVTSRGGLLPSPSCQYSSIFTNFKPFDRAALVNSEM